MVPRGGKKVPGPGFGNRTDQWRDQQAECIRALRNPGSLDLAPKQAEHFCFKQQRGIQASAKKPPSAWIGCGAAPAMRRHSRLAGGEPDLSRWSCSFPITLQSIGYE